MHPEHWAEPTAMYTHMKYKQYKKAKTYNNLEKWERANIAERFSCTPTTLSYTWPYFAGRFSWLLYYLHTITPLPREPV